MMTDDGNIVSSSCKMVDESAGTAFLKPKPISVLSSTEKFKKPVLIGPRKGLKKFNSSNTEKLPVPESQDPENAPDGQSVAPPPNLVEIPSSPLVISDFSDKVLPSEFPYTEPAWKGVPEEKYFLEELKSGVIEKEIDLQGRSYTVLGRLDHCHVTMAHPTVSRYHAVLQYRAARQGIYDKGFYLYDMGSTHGTFLNKNRIKPQTYVRIQVGHVMKFGCSTRMFILQGPTEDQEPESEFTVTELKEMRQQELQERERRKEEESELLKQKELKEKEELENRGVDWGISEDADEETDLSENPYAVTTNEELYIDDPKKELKKWFEREGEELTLETEQAERGKMVCRITLPLDNGKGGEVIIESTGKSKKEANTSCALEACRYIDRIGLFRQSNQESKKRQVKNWEDNDFYDSDEDSFFDRTGDVDEKRQKRMKKAGKIQDTVETYESLMENHKRLLRRIAEVEKKYNGMTSALNAYKRSSKEDMDELDLYMSTLKQTLPNKLEIKMCQVELNNLKEEEKRLVTLINLARPTSLPELKPYIPPSSVTTTESPVEAMSVENNETSMNNLEQERSDKQETNKERLVEESSSESQPSFKPILGPQRPPTADNTDIVKKKRSRVRQRDRSQKMSDSNQYDSSEFSDLTWQPPAGQTGDGRTSLNDKYGY